MKSEFYATKFASKDERAFEAFLNNILKFPPMRVKLPFHTNIMRQTSV